MTRGHSDLAVAALAAAAALGLTAAVLARRRSNRAPAARRRIYVARHAQKQRNQPESDNLLLALSPEGREALGVLKEYLVANGITFATTYASPFVRCRQTAEMPRGRFFCSSCVDATRPRKKSGKSGRRAADVLRPPRFRRCAAVKKCGEPFFCKCSGPFRTPRKYCARSRRRR